MPKVLSRLCPSSVETLTRTTQETLPDQLDTPHVTTAVAARQAAKKAVSEMSIVAAPVQSMASAVSGTDPINLIDWISSFLKTLEKFNTVADKIATVSVTLCPADAAYIHSMSRSILTCN